MSCDTGDDLDRQIAAARDRRHLATTEDEINATDQQEYDLALEMSNTWLFALRQGRPTGECSVIQL